MPASKTKSIPALLLILAILGTIYFYLENDSFTYSKASLLQGQSRVSASEAKQLEDQGYVCYPEVLSKNINCEETKFGSSCDLVTKASSNYICNQPELKENINDPLKGF